MCDVTDVVRGLRQSSRSLHILFPLRAQYDGALGVEERPVAHPVAHDHHLEHRGAGSAMFDEK